MSSEYWAEPFLRGEGGQRRPEGGAGRGSRDRTPGCGSVQHGEKLRQGVMEGPPRGKPGLTLDNDRDEVTAEGGVSQVQPEEDDEEDEGRSPGEKTKRSAQRPEEHGPDGQTGGTGVCPVERYLGHSRDRMPEPTAAPQPCHQARTRKRQTEQLQGSGPFYFFGGANGATIVTSYCESRGWSRIQDKHRDDFKLKWCETKSSANYYNFREGEQLIFQIPNNNLLTTKIGLLSSLREYERVSSKINHGGGQRRLKMEEFFPATFRMDVKDERESFFAQLHGVNNKESHMWICKPTGLNQGRGIFLVKTKEEIATLRLRLQEMGDSHNDRKTRSRQPQARIVQRYLKNPLLLKGKKFDVRSYFLIACTAPYMVFFRHGYVRLTCDLYDPNSNNLSTHLTNQYMQKKNPLYSELKEDTVWTMEMFNSYVNDTFSVAKGLSRDWVLGVFTKRMKQIMTQCFFAVKSKLDRKLGYFDLIGCDFMVDEDFKVWLLEMNCNPALHTNCEVLKEVVPSTVVETLDIALEIFNKCRSGLQILPLDSQKEFVLLYNGQSLGGMVSLPCSNNRKGRAASKSAYHSKASKGHPTDELQTRRKLREKTNNASVTTSDITVNVLETHNMPDGSNPANPGAKPSLTDENLPIYTPPNSNTVLVVPPKPSLMLRALATPKHIPRLLKPAQPRVELRLSRCVWQNDSRHLGHQRSPEDLQGKSNILSRSTPALCGGTLTLITRLPANKGGLGSDQSQSFCSPLKDSQLGLNLPLLGRPVWSERQEKREQLSG